jgi:hypothetical protein
MPELILIGHGTKPTLEGYPWPYDVWISFDDPDYPIALAEGVAHGSASGVFRAEEILNPGWREHLAICKCEWLIHFVRKARADGVKVTPELLEAAWRAPR